MIGYGVYIDSGRPASHIPHTHHLNTTQRTTQEAALLDAVRAGVAAGALCQRCGPAHLAIGGRGEGIGATTGPSILPDWTRALLGTAEGGSDGDRNEEPHPCDALAAALASLRADPRRRAQTVVTMGSAAGVVDARGHLIRAVLGQFEGTAGALAGRVRTALALLRTLLVLDDAALLSSPMEVRFALRCGEGTTELVGAALDMFLIERDPAKYDALRYVFGLCMCVFDWHTRPCP